MTFYLGMNIALIRTELAKQIDDLERYGVIPEKMAKFGGDGGGDGKVKNGGYGEFDVGVLNARASAGQVGGEDVLGRVKGVVEELMMKIGVDMPEIPAEDMAVDG